MAAATRDGPSRLTSTAASSGESKATLAAEWTTTSQAARASRPASSRPSPSRATSPATAPRRAATWRVEGVAELGAQLVEAVVAQDLALGPLRRRRAPGGAHQDRDAAVGHGPQQPLDEGGAEEAGRPGDQDALAGQELADRAQGGHVDLCVGHGVCLPYGR